MRIIAKDNMVQVHLHQFIICISACAQEDSDLHQSSKVRRDAPG